MNKKCTFYRVSRIFLHKNKLIFINLNLDENNNDMYGFGYGFAQKSLNEKDIDIDLKLMEILLSFDSLQKVKEVYDNYSLFI